MTHIAVAVSPDQAPGIETTLAEALDRAELPLNGKVRSLSDSAAEADIVLDNPVQETAFESRLASVGADGAILPAANRKKRLLICDMDSTIIQQECLDELADFAGLKEEISAITERAMRGELNFEEALTHRVSMLAGLSVYAIEDCYRDRIQLSAGAQTLVRTMAADGARCLLVSGGFTAFTSRVAEAAGFHAHHANTLLDDGAELTGKVGLPILGREAKQTTLLETAKELGLAAEDALAMGDGANDLAMIQTAGLGIAYRAKPVVAEASDAAINQTDLTTALFYQGYTQDEFVSP